MEFGCNSLYFEKIKFSILFFIVILCKNVELMLDMDIVDLIVMYIIINEKWKSIYIFLNRDDSLIVIINFICEGLWIWLFFWLILVFIIWFYKLIGIIICFFMV